MPQITLTITMNDQGGINVNGPIENKLLCFGLLECAKIAIQEHAKAVAENKVQPAPPGLVIPRA